MDLAAYNSPGQANLKEWGWLNNVQWVIAPHVDVGMVYVFAVGSLAVYAIVLGGWSSNSKYSFLGALRSSAQLISYEIPLGLAVLGVFFVTGSLNVERIIEYQHAHGWNFLFQPVAALLFAASIFAECNRLPFDLAGNGTGIGGRLSHRIYRNEAAAIPAGRVRPHGHDQFSDGRAVLRRLGIAA